MKKYCLLLVVLIVGCAATSRVYDLREFPTYRLGLVQVGWLDPNWSIDVWVNSPAYKFADFTLLPGWQKEWLAETDSVSVYAEAWIWDNGRKLIVAETKKPVRVKVSKARDWDGYGWRVWLQSGDFTASRPVFQK